MDDFVGKGFRFPIRVNARGGLSWSVGPDRVRDAIWIIMTTALGERTMLPTFGAGVANYVLQSNSAMIRTQLGELHVLARRKVE